MRRFILLAMLIGLAVALSAQSATTDKSATPTKKTHHHMTGMPHHTLGWRCHKHDTVCVLSVEDILAAQDSPTHKGCNPAEAIYVSVDKKQSLLIVKHNMQRGDFTLTIDQDPNDKVKASKQPFEKMPPKDAVDSWYSGPATADPGTCYHLHVTISEGANVQQKDPHIMFCGGGLLCE